MSNSQKDPGLYQWDIGSGKILKRVERAHANGQSAVADNGTLATCSFDKAVKLCVWGPQATCLRWNPFGSLLLLHGFSTIPMAAMSEDDDPPAQWSVNWSRRGYRRSHQHRVSTRGGGSGRR